MNNHNQNPCICIWSACIFKKVLDIANENRFKYITEDKIFEAFKRVVHTAPISIYRDGLREMIQWQLIKKIPDSDWYVILDNAQTKKVKKKLNKSNPSVYPF